jgi:hypothetical protein
MLQRSVPLIALLIAVLTSACSGQSGPSSEGPESFPSPEAGSAETLRAIASLRKMSDFLATHSTLRFEAEIHYDAIQTSGQKIEFGSHRRITMRRPDRIRVEITHHEGSDELVTFDGRRLSAAAPGYHAYASTEFTGTVPEVLDHLVNEYRFASPLSDLLREDLADVVEGRAVSGRRIGVVSIAGKRCEHLAFRGDRVDLQIFIEEGEVPIPVRIVIDYPEEEGAPQFRARLGSWELQPELPDSLFRLRPPVGAQRVPFEELLDLLLGPLDGEERVR